MTTKIYTKKGDNGTTNLYDMRSLSKSDTVFDALGDLDELASHIGHLCSLIQKNPVLHFNKGNSAFTVVADRSTGIGLGQSENPIHKDLRWIQVMLLNIGSDISTKDISKHMVTDENVLYLEERTDFYNEKCPKLTEFILLGSSQQDAVAHICRAVSRRTERNMWKSEEYGNSNCFKFMNRLSSFFFALGRYMADDNEVTRSMYDLKKI